MCIDGKDHELVSAEIATPDGGRIPYMYCRKCGAEWK